MAMKSHSPSSCYVIAEAGLNHNGSLDIAKQLIDVASIAKADAVKFQKRTVDKLAIGSVLDAEDKRFPELGKTYREIRTSIEFNREEYIQLKDYAESKGLDFIVTAFDNDAVDFLEDIGITKYKLASHSLTNLDLLSYLSSKGKEVILSTGMADLEEIDRAVEIFRKSTSTLSLMHCVSSYPTPIEDCNLSMVDNLRKRYALRTGYSGHELGYIPTLTAVARGAQLVERHFTLDKEMIGFDHKMSLDPTEFISMVRDIRQVEQTFGTGKKSISETEWITRRKYHVSMVSAVNIDVGQTLTEDMITYRNPGTGIPCKKAHTVLGKKAINKIEIDELLSEDMFA